MELKTYFAQDSTGSVIPGATAYVYVANTQTPITGLVSASGAPLTNPMLSDSTGMIQFKAPNGDYSLRIVSQARDTTISIQCKDLTDDVASKVGSAELATALGVSSVAALRALNTQYYTRATTLGYTTIGDGGQGSYYFTATASLPVDNGVTIFRSDDGLGYWSLIHNGTLDIKQAGAQAGVNCSPVLTRAMTAIVASAGGISKLVFSSMPTGYQFATQVLFNASNITYELWADLKNTSTAYVTPFIFSNDLLAQPAAPLTNVTIVGNGFSIDSNGLAIYNLLGYAPGFLPAFPQAIFNYIDNLKLLDTTFKNGVYDSCNLRQCRNHLIKKCTFRDAVQYLANGLNITTNWATYVRGDYTTYSHGVVEDCLLINNASMGGTYYHCCGGTFRRCVAYGNGTNNGTGGSGSGFSYEMPSGAFSIKYADGLFEACHSNNNGINGFYINTPGVIVDDACTTYGNGVLGLANDVSGLQMCGVCVSGADDVIVRGTHENNARHGVTLLGAVGLQPTWKIGGVYRNNAASGINIQGLYRCDIEPGTKLIKNGRTLIGGVYTVALNVTNSAYNTADGILNIDGLQFDQNGNRDMNVVYVGNVTVRNCMSYNNNDLRGSTGGTGYSFGALSLLYLQNNLQDIPNGWTTNGYVIGNDVLKAWVYGNKSTQVTGNVMLNNASVRFGISGNLKMGVGTYTPLLTLPSTGTATLADVSNVLSTLIIAQQDGLMQS